MSAATFHEFGAARRRELQRAVAISVVGHAVVVGALLLEPSFGERRIIGSTIVTVDLVASAPPPAPRPAPAPPGPRKVLLPARPTRTAPEVLPVPEVAKPEPAVEEEYDDLLAKLRADAGEAQPDPVELARREPEPPPQAAPSPAARPAPALAPSGPTGVRVSPEVAAWVRDARLHVRREWVLAPGFRFEDLETHLSVELDSDGRLQGEPRVTRRSGNPWYDESVVRAIQKADPLPAPPEAGQWPFVFRPEDR